MGENSGIQWTTHTFNPWVGCQRVSPGCVNCYAETYDKRVGGAVDPADGKKKLRWGPQAPRVRTSKQNWNKVLKWENAARARGVRERVFCSSLADVFEDRPELVPWREDLFGLIASTPSLDWLLLTKRPENIDRLWPEVIAEPNGGTYLPCPRPSAYAWRNVWLGTTVEDQQRADERIPELLSVDAAVRFLSCEPLLERVVISPWLANDVDWVIIGGESGQKARPFDLSWARSLVSQARSAGAAPFVKQLGAVPVVDESEWRVGSERGVRMLNGHNAKKAPAGTVPLLFSDAHAGDPAEWPEDLRIREFPEPRHE